MALRKPNAAPTTANGERFSIVVILRLVMVGIFAIPHLLPQSVVAQGETSETIIFDGPNFKVHIEPSRAFTITVITHGGITVMDASSCGSCQGTVVRVLGGSWLGSCHGGETVQTISLQVDGIERELRPGTTYSGRLFELDKGSTLGDLIGLQARTVVSRTTIREHAQLTTLMPELSLATVYAFLSTHGNAFTDVMGVRWPDKQVIRGVTNLDDGSSFQLGASYVVAQYDPVQQLGVSSHFTRTMAGNGVAFVWDRICDNKLYFRFRGYTNPVPLGSTWSFSTVRFMFVPNGTEWEDAARWPPGDFNQDGTVDLADFARFQTLFGANAAGTEIDILDFDGNGTIDAEDYFEFVALLTGPA